MIPNVKFYSAGHFTSRERWRHPVTTRRTWEFIYMTEGEAHIYAGEESFSLKAGDALLLPSGIEHGGSEYSAERVSFIWMHFLAEDAAAEAHLASLPRLVKSVGSTPLPSLARTLLHKSRLSVYKKDLLDTSAALFVLEYETWARVSSLDGGGELVQRVSEWVRINSDKPLTVKDVACEFGYNPDYLSSLFRRKTGGSLKAIIDEGRMNALRTELLTTDTPLKQIAMDHAFADYKSFLKFFTYHEGMTPTEYREACYMTHKNNK